MPSAVFNQNTIASHQVVAAPGAGFFIRVHGWHLQAAGTVTVTLRSAATNKVGPMAMTATGANTASGFSYDGWFDCAVNEALNIDLAQAIQVGGVVNYSIRTG